MASASISQERLKELLSYDPDTGIFTRNAPLKNRPHSQGSIVGCRAPHGYIVITLDRKQYYAHRLAWLFVHGCVPEFLDHIDRDRSNNRIENLREADRRANGINRDLSSGEGSDTVGVQFFKHGNRKKWRVSTSFNGTQKYEYFERKDDAVAFRKSFELTHYGEFNPA